MSSDNNMTDTTTTTTTTTTDMKINQEPVFRSATCALRNIPAKVGRSFTNAVRSMSSFHPEEQNTKSSNDAYNDILKFQGDWKDTPYEPEDLRVGDNFFHDLTQTLTVAAVGTQKVEEVKDYPDGKTDLYETDCKMWDNRPPTDSDTNLERVVNGFPVDKAFFDVICRVTIGSMILNCTYNSQNIFYNGTIIASHSGDVLENHTIGVKVQKLDETTTKKYYSLKKLRHTVGINIPYLSKIAESEAVAVYIYYAGYRNGNMDTLNNYIAQETVIDIRTVSNDNKKKQLIQAPTSSEFSGVLGQIYTFGPDGVKINITEMYEQGIVTNVCGLHSRVVNKYRDELVKLVPSLSSETTPDVNPQPQPPVMRTQAQRIMRSNCGPLQYHEI